jgi:tetratricopeptide (TPR) repeat protein
VLVALGVGGYFGVPQLLGFYHWHAAQKAQERREFALAHQHLAGCLSVWPHSVTTQLAAARAARRAGLLQEADDHLRACQDSEEQTSDEWRLQYNLLAVKRDGLNPLQERYLQDALRQGCSDPLEVMEALSEEYLRRDRYPDAQALLDAWLEMRPDDVEALARRGWVWDHLFNFDRTRADYERVLALDPSRDSVRQRLAEILVLNNHADLAGEHVEQLRTRKPDDPAVCVLRARYLEKLGRIKEAGQVLDDLLERRPEDAQLLTERGKIALDEHCPVDAQAFLQRALKSAPRDRQIIYNMSQCLQSQGKKAEAQRYQALLKEIDEDIRTVGKLRAEVPRKPYNADLRYQIGVIFLKNSQIADAMHWFESALEVDRRHRPTYEALIAYHERTGNQEQVRRYREILQEIGAKR